MLARREGRSKFRTELLLLMIRMAGCKVKPKLLAGTEGAQEKLRQVNSARLLL
jgi:hypothetical protein